MPLFRDEGEGVEARGRKREGLGPAVDELRPARLMGLGHGALADPEHVEGQVDADDVRAGPGGELERDAGGT